MTRLTLVVMGLVLSSCIWAAPGYRGPCSEHYDGREFFNPDHPEKHEYLKSAMIFGFTSPEPWEKRDITPSTPPRRVSQGELRITFVNHSTILVQADGVNILTDPIYAAVAGPVAFMGAKRVHSPGVAFADLPAIDVVLLSHNHYDHMDLPTLRTLARTHKPRILAGLGTKKLLDEAHVLGAEDLDWWQSTDVVPGIRITVVPARHWSRRGLGDTDNTLWCGFVITTKGGPVYFAGDTGYGEHFDAAHARFGPMRAALLPIGAYKPEDHLRPWHLSPESALDAHTALDSQLSVAMHFGTFHLGFEGQDEAQQVLVREARRRGVSDFVVLEPGGAIDVPRLAQ